MRILLAGLLIGLLSFASASCSRSDSGGTPEIVEMQFAVVDALLGPEVVFQDPPYSLRPPLGWERIDPQRRDALLARLSSASGPDPGSLPVELFADSTGALLTVSRWNSAASTWKEALRQQMADYAGAPEGSVTHAEFLLAGRPCLQTRVVDAQRVAFKLLLADGLRLDYILPAGAYAQQAERLESSIGSVRSSTTH